MEMVPPTQRSPSKLSRVSSRLLGRNHHRGHKESSANVKKRKKKELCPHGQECMHISREHAALYAHEEDKYEERTKEQCAWCKARSRVGRRKEPSSLSMSKATILESYFKFDTPSEDASNNEEHKHEDFSRDRAGVEEELGPYVSWDETSGELVIEIRSSSIEFNWRRANEDEKNFFGMTFDLLFYNVLRIEEQYNKDAKDPNKKTKARKTRDNERALGWKKRKQQAELMTLLFLGKSKRIERHFLNFNWNFQLFIPGRGSPVTPLSQLVRPELTDSLFLEPKDGQERQRKLLEKLLDHALEQKSKQNLSGEERKGILDIFQAQSRAITDVVYQGRVSLLKVFVKKYPQLTGNDLQHPEHLHNISIQGSSLLHMAAFDGRPEMCRFLLQECKFEVDLLHGPSQRNPSNVGQTALFWAFGLGNIEEKCARALWQLGANPLFLWQTFPKPSKQVKAAGSPPNHAALMPIKPGEKGSGCVSPLSMSIVSCPSFALDVLKRQRKKTGYRGVTPVYKTNFIGIIVSSIGNEIKFMDAPVEPKNNKIKNMHSFNYDEDEKSQKSLIEIMIQHKRRKLLLTPIIQHTLEVMWEQFAKDVYRWEVGCSSIFWFSYSMFILFFESGIRQEGDRFIQFRQSEDTTEFELCASFGVLAGIVTVYFLCVEITGACTIGCEIHFHKNRNKIDMLIYACTLMQLGLASYLHFGLEQDCPSVWGPLERHPNVSRCTTTSSNNGDPPEGHYRNSAYLFFYWKMINFGIHMLMVYKFLDLLSVPRSTGMFASLIWRMIGDVWTFLRLFILFFVAFFLSFWPLVKNSMRLPEAGADPTDSNWFLVGNFAFRMLVWMQGELNFDELGKWERDSLLAKTVFIFYSVATAILLFNMLIAMMNSTYTRMEEDKAGEWALNFAKYIYEVKNSKPPRRSKQAFLQLRDRSKKNDERVSPSAERSAAQRKEEEEQNEVDEKVDGLDKVRSEEGAWVQEIRKGVERLQEEKGAAERLGWQVQQLREDMSRLIQQQGPGRPPALYPQFSTSSRPQPHTQSHSRHGGGGQWPPQRSSC